MPFPISCLRKNDWLRPVTSASSLNRYSIAGSTGTAMICGGLALMSPPAE